MVASNALGRGHDTIILDGDLLCLVALADARSQPPDLHGPAARRDLLPDLLARLEALGILGEEIETHAVVLGADGRPNAHPDWPGREAESTRRLDEADRLVVARRALAVGQLHREKVLVLPQVREAR